MILEEDTFDAFGYEMFELKQRSHKPIIAACDECGKVRKVRKSSYHALCKSCVNKGKKRTEESKALMSAAQKGNTNCLRRECSKETRARMSVALKGRTLPEETKAKISAANKGEKNPRWNGGKELCEQRHNAKRRELGYTLLMPVKDGEHSHHVTNEYVIGIPAEVHNSIGGCREKHRTKVLQWLKMHDKKKYKMVLCVLAKQ